MVLNSWDTTCSRAFSGSRRPADLLTADADETRRDRAFLLTRAILRRALCRLGPRHSATSFHTHQDFYELFFVLSGRGQHRLSVAAQALSAGDLVLVRPADWHDLVGLPPTGLEWINVAVPAATWRGLLDMAGVVSADDLNRERLPTLAGVSAGHLCRTIRAHYGMTPTSFVADLRLRHAEMLLATTTSSSLTDISYRCGFSCPSYFSKSFRSSRGESPRDFRHRAREAVLPRGRTEFSGV
jgi:AraC-like DNA-binding protein